MTELERTELSEAVVGEGKRLSRLVENLLDISSLETGAAEPRREQVDLAEVLEAARDSVGPGREIDQDHARRRVADAERRCDPARTRLCQPA